MLHNYKSKTTSDSSRLFCAPFGLGFAKHVGLLSRNLNRPIASCRNTEGRGTTIKFTNYSSSSLQPPLLSSNPLEVEEVDTVHKSAAEAAAAALHTD